MGEDEKQSKSNNIEKQATKEVAKGAANAYFGPVGGKAVDALSKTKLGDAVLTKGTESLKNPKNIMNPANMANNGVNIAKQGAQSENSNRRSGDAPASSGSAPGSSMNLDDGDKKSGGSGTKTTINSEVIVNATDLEVLTAMVYCEAGGESYECQLAVASVIMNRVKSWKFANSIKGVVFQKGQFPPATNGKLEKRLKSGKVSSSCLQAAQAAMAGQDNTDGCLYFNDYNGSRQGLRIGGMVFWKSW